jgi:pimeloyl-ACP methyl ester carboxylesterase
LKIPIQENLIMTRTLRRCVVAIFLAALLVSLGTAVQAQESWWQKRHGSLGGPMLLADEGVFFVNTKVITSNYPTAPATGAPVPGSFVINQMYVHYRIPASRRHRLPIVMVHGGGLTGVTYETTPDGREGWATYFARRGFAVYVLDFPGRGRSGFDPTSVNKAKVVSDASLVPELRRTTNEAAWTAFRFGPAYLDPYPDTQYPLEALEEFSAQGVPYAEATLQGGSFGTWSPALAALLDKIGPAIVLVHSQSGPFADILVGMRAALVKGVINVEGNQLTIPTDAQIAAYREVPDLELFGDHVNGNPASTGQSRYDGRKAVVARINAAGGDAQILQLPEIGLYGNTHMMMQDKNNLKIADFLIRWIERKVERERH